MTAEYVTWMLLKRSKKNLLKTDLYANEGICLNHPTPARWKKINSSPSIAFNTYLCFELGIVMGFACSFYIIPVYRRPWIRYRKHCVSYNNEYWKRMWKKEKKHVNFRIILLDNDMFFLIFFVNIIILFRHTVCKKKKIKICILYFSLTAT